MVEKNTYSDDEPKTETHRNYDDERKNGAHYLWHLGRIGLLDDEDAVSSWAQFNSGQTPKQASRVAIIDNGCVSSHPNLPIDRIQNAIEFAYDFAGTLYPEPNRLQEGYELSKEELLDSQKTTSSNVYDNLHENLNRRGIPKLEELTEDALHGGKSEVSPPLRRVLTRLIEPANSTTDDVGVPKKVEAVPNPSYRFSAHGTACAGLVGADAASYGDSGVNSIPRNPFAIRYAGINRFAEIIPIATVYSHEYWPMVMALIYAVAQNADVILIPRAVEEMVEPGKLDAEFGEEDPRYSTFQSDSNRYNEKLLFDKLLKEISNKVPVIVAAGNSGCRYLEYPAKLVDQGASSLIVVGAVNSKNLRSAYSSTSKNDGNTGAQGVTVYAPSDDSQELSQDFTRYDELSWRGRRLWRPDYEGAGANGYSNYGILSIDVPGAYGYDGSTDQNFDSDEGRLPGRIMAESRSDPGLQPTSLYTMFGGTSAASSIVAGVVSMMQSVQKEGDFLTGAEAKSIIQSAVWEPPKLPEKQLDQLATKQSEEEVSNASSDYITRTLNACDALDEAINWQNMPNRIDDGE